jgi:Rv2175c C-terminal domain of unknown function
VSLPSLSRRSWQSRTVSELPEVTWLTIPDLTEILGLKVSQVRRLIEDRALLARKIDGVWKVPELFIVGGEPLGDLRGTLVVLSDSGYSDDEAMEWLLGIEDSLGATPIDALRSGRKAEVRRIAQALGF